MAAYSRCPILARYPQILELIQAADHADIKTVESSKPLRPFVAAMFSYSPAWIRVLFAIRRALAWLLGLDQVRSRNTLTADDVPMHARGQLELFIKASVVMAKADEYWLAEAVDKHLSGVVGVVSEPLDQKRWRHHVLTLVNYRDPRGPVYFNLIRPFHHLVAWAMARGGAR